MAIVARRMKRCLWFASVVKLATHEERIFGIIRSSFLGVVFPTSGEET